MVLTNRGLVLIVLLAGVVDQVGAQRGGGDPPVGRGRGILSPLAGRGRLGDSGAVFGRGRVGGPAPFGGRGRFGDSVPLVGRGRVGGPRALLFGFALECVECSRNGRGVGAVGVWHYSEYPRVAAVAAGGAAERAGIQEGDILMSADGISLLTDEGARRFAEARLGDEVRLTLGRGNKTIDALLTLGRAIDSPVSRIPDGSQPRSYSGYSGSAAIDVWSVEPVIESTDSTGALLLRIGNTTIRIDSRASNARGRGRGGARTP